jgi:hypothetical protein
MRHALHVKLDEPMLQHPRRIQPIGGQLAQNSAAHPPLSYQLVEQWNTLRRGCLRCELGRQATGGQKRENSYTGQRKAS